VRTRASNGTAFGVRGSAEGLLKFVSQRIQAEKCVGQDDRDHGCAETERRDETERYEQAEQPSGPVQQQRARKGRRGGPQALAGGLDLSHRQQPVGEEPIEVVGDVATPPGHGKIIRLRQQNCIRRPGPAPDMPRFSGREPLRRRGEAVTAELTPHGMGEGNRPQHEAALRHRLLRHQRPDVAREGANLGKELTPLAARFPPPLVTGVVAEAEEDGQGKAEQREGGRRQPREPAGRDAGDRRHGGGPRTDDGKFRRDSRDDRPPQDEEQTEGAGTGRRIMPRHLKELCSLLQKEAVAFLPFTKPDSLTVMVKSAPPLRPHGAAYYLDHFRQVLEAVKQRYGFLLDPTEHAHIHRIEALREPAQMLYARLVNRRGPCFRYDRLSYPEIPTLEAAVAELVAQSLLVPCDTGLEAAIRRKLYGCFTLSELRASLTEHRLPRPVRKGDLLSWLEGWDGSTPWLEGLLARHPVLRLPPRDPWPFLRFLFFGELRDNLSDFVTRELGFIVTESVEKEKLRAQFATRQAAADANRMACLYMEFRAMRDTQPAVDTLRWWQAQAIDRAALRAGVASFDRLVDRLGRRLERAGAFAESLNLYATSPAAPVRERQARLLIKDGRRQEAIELLQAIAKGASDAEEAYVARQLLARLAKTARRSEARQYQQSSRHIILEDTEQSVETATLGYYRRAGWQGVHSENWLWNAIFGLLLWDIIYDPAFGAFHSPLQFAPADLHDPGFYDRRQARIEERLALLRDPAESFAMIAARHDEKAGLANPFVSWHEGLLKLIRIAVDRLPASGLGAVLRRFAQDIKRRSRGFPDLFLWTAAEYRFVEVKSENDQLSAAQYQWLRFLDEAGISVSLDRVSREQAETKARSTTRKVGSST
jgi:hypothetical protein